VEEWAERWREARGGDKVHRNTATEVRTCGGGEGIDTEAKEMRDSVDRGGHKVEHEGPLGRVGGRSRGSGTHLRIVGEGATATEEREEGDQEGAGGGVGERDKQELMNKGERKKERRASESSHLPSSAPGRGSRHQYTGRGGGEEKETGNFKEFTKCEAAPVKSTMADGMGRREGAKREEECRGSAGQEGVAAAGLCGWRGEEGEEWCRDVGEGGDRRGQEARGAKDARKNTCGIR
jgi:hypothetical protein